MKKSKIWLMLPMLLPVYSQAADVSLTLSGASDYRFRGISQTAGDPAIQGSLDVAWDSGIYVGAWASNLDYDDDADKELDVYIGYNTDLTENINLDLLFNHYTYPGYDEDIDYSEFFVTLAVADFTFQYAYADDYGNSDESGHYLGADYSHLLSDKVLVFEDVSLNLHGGYSFGDYWDDVDIGDYYDYSIGVSAMYRGFEISAAYLVNSIDNKNDVSSGAFRNDNTILLTLSYTFDLFSW